MRSNYDAIAAQLDAAKGSGQALPAPASVALRRASEIHPEAVTWLWRDWLAADMLQIVAGAPGTGKTTLALSLAATLSSGGRWPDGTRACAGDVLIWSGEDVVSKTLLPRLMAMQANRERIYFVDVACGPDGKRPFDPATDFPVLQATIEGSGIRPRLLIVDPIVSAVAGDSHKNGETRRALQPLVELAERLGCAVVGISHFSKGTQGRDPTERVSGSLAFGALARIVLATAKAPEDQGGYRLLVRAKSNLGPDEGGFRYELEQIGVPGNQGLTASNVVWGESIQGTARDILAQAEAADDEEGRSATSEAMDWLRDHLSREPVEAGKVLRAGKSAGHTDKALRRAKDKLGVKSRKQGYSGSWLWALRDDFAPEDAPKVPKAPNSGDGHLRHLGNGEGILGGADAPAVQPWRVEL